tara:strand:+ start:247 stop:435 length:189 start_codon:yes stop_codon:yes gene_type:complete
MSISIGDYVKTTEEYNPFLVISGKVIEDYGSTVVIEDEESETNDCRLEFSKSDLQIKTEEPQ